MERKALVATNPCVSRSAGRDSLQRPETSEANTIPIPAGQASGDGPGGRVTAVPNKYLTKDTSKIT